MTPCFLNLFLLNTNYYSGATKTNKKKKSSRSHFINCCYVPKHISSLKHLDIFVIEHFSLPLVKYASQFICVRVHSSHTKCVCKCLRLWTWLIPFVHEGDVQSSKLKQHMEWAIDGSINWYTVLVMSSVRNMSLFYGLNLKYFQHIFNIYPPSGCN